MIKDVLRASSGFTLLPPLRLSHSALLPETQANDVERHMTRDSRHMIRLTLPSATVRWHSTSPLTQNAHIPWMRATGWKQRYDLLPDGNDWVARPHICHCPQHELAARLPVNIAEPH